jgi:antibiotic biosynthesis monooxygenase (ABM) superfamily enzyme
MAVGYGFKLQRRQVMLKVIIGYKTKPGADILPMIVKLRSHAMTYPGYVGAENLMNNHDVSIVAIITTWEDVEYFRDWENSRTRLAIMEEFKDLLDEEPKVSVYRLIPTKRWV